MQNTGLSSLACIPEAAVTQRLTTSGNIGLNMKDDTVIAIFSVITVREAETFFFSFPFLKSSDLEFTKEKVKNYLLITYKLLETEVNLEDNKSTLTRVG